MDNYQKLSICDTREQKVMKSLLETLLLGQLIMASIFGFYMQNVETDVTCVVQGYSYTYFILFQIKYFYSVNFMAQQFINHQVYKPLTMDEFDDAKSKFQIFTNVSSQFSQIIGLYLIYFVIASAMNIIKLYELKIRKRIFPNITYVRWLNDLLAIVAMIKLHIYRLSHPGKVCSGSFMLDDDNSENLAKILQFW